MLPETPETAHERLVDAFRETHGPPVGETAPGPMRPEDLARLFHTTYERLAPEHGYETRKASAVPWEDVPAANKSLMIAVAGEVLIAVRAKVAGELEALRDGVVGKDKPYNKAFLHGVACAIHQARGEQPADVAPEPEPVVITIDADTSGFDDAVDRAKEAVIRAEERAKVAEEIAEPTVWPDPFGHWTADRADAARAMKKHIIRRITRGEQP